MARDWKILSGEPVDSLLFRQAGDKELRLLVMRPEEGGGAAPCIVWIHGGGFTSGTAEVLLPQCRYYSSLGYVCVSVEYRLMELDGETPRPDGAQLEQQVADCREAVRYVRRHAEQLGIDPRRIALVGESAGGYLAAGVTTLPDDEEEEGSADAVSCVPDALILYNPITQLLGNWKRRIAAAVEESAQSWLERHTRAREMSPLLRLTAAHPPTLLMHGLADSIVPPEDSAEYAARLTELGVSAQLELLPASSHAFALFNYKASERELALTLEKTTEFLKTVFEG
ncbi:alpha/beta hydrolase [Cohnella fermenti]|nr:alpha/beta hydrolase [Cohnella fermenti]